MRKLFDVVVLTLAVNFLALAGVVVWLQQTGRLDRDKVLAIRAMLVEGAEVEEIAVEDEAAAVPVSPADELEALLARQAGQAAMGQVPLAQPAFDAQMAQLDRRQRELDDLQRQVELAKRQLAADRQGLETDRDRLDSEREETARLAADKGFQDSLERYTKMPSRQAKSIFMELEEEAVVRYLRAMPPRTAARIIREFKTAEEMHRLQSVMEMMRLTGAAADASKE
jgi:hypothetical protein